jgi:hypothetical protein
MKKYFTILRYLLIIALAYGSNSHGMHNLFTKIKIAQPASAARTHAHGPQQRHYNIWPFNKTELGMLRLKSIDDKVIGVNDEEALKCAQIEIAHEKRFYEEFWSTSLSPSHKVFLVGLPVVASVGLTYSHFGSPWCSLSALLLGFSPLLWGAALVDIASHKSLKRKKLYQLKDDGEKVERLLEALSVTKENNNMGEKGEE